MTGVCWGISLMARGIHSTDAKAPSPTIGYPDRWEAFNQRHAKFVATCYPDLVDLSKAVLNRHVRITSVADDVIFLLGRTAFEDFCELWVLAGNGYGIGAFKILRGLYEKVVTLGYLVKHPNEIQRFIDYGIVQTMRLMNRAKKQNFTRSKFSDAEYLAAEEAYQAVKGKFLDAKGRSLSWSPLDTFSMAMKSGYGLEEISVPGYVIPNLKIHPSISDLSERKIPSGGGTFSFSAEPQEQYADSALVTGTHTLIVALQIHDGYFKLGVGPVIEQVQTNFALAYLKP